MAAEQVTLYNSKTSIQANAQTFMGRALATYLANPGQNNIVLASSIRHNVYRNNGPTGPEVARRMYGEDTTT